MNREVLCNTEDCTNLHEVHIHEKLVLADVTEILLHRFFKHQDINKVKVRACSRKWEERNAVVEIFKSNISFKNYPTPPPENKNDRITEKEEMLAKIFKDWPHVLNSTSVTVIILH